MAKIAVKSWSIGPRHDPYNAEVLTFIKTNGDKVKYYRDGLGRVRIEFNDQIVMEGFFDSMAEEEPFYAKFEELAGLSFDRAHKIHSRNYTTSPYEDAGMWA